MSHFESQRYREVGEGARFQPLVRTAGEECTLREPRARVVERECACERVVLRGSSLFYCRLLGLGCGVGLKQFLSSVPKTLEFVRAAGAAAPATSHHPLPVAVQRAARALRNFITHTSHRPLEEPLMGRSLPKTHTPLAAANGDSFRKHTLLYGLTKTHNYENIDGRAARCPRSDVACPSPSPARCQPAGRSSSCAAATGRAPRTRHCQAATESGSRAGCRSRMPTGREKESFCQDCPRAALDPTSAPGASRLERRTRACGESSRCRAGSRYTGPFAR